VDHGRGRSGVGRLTLISSPTPSSWPSLRRALLVAALALAPTPAGAQIFETIGIRAQGMGGAFVAVSDDATTTWWNPAGLPGGGFFNTVLEFDRIEDQAGNRARGLAITVPSLGLSYYRLSLNAIRPSVPTDPDEASRQDEGALGQFGITVGQSVGDRLVIASTLKIVHALDETHGDLDIGVMGMLGPVRVGLAAKNLRTPEFAEGAAEAFELVRQVRAGASFSTASLSPAAGSGARLELVAAVDGDLTTTPTPFGESRHLAAGAEGWLLSRAVGIRAGVGINTIGDSRRSGSVGVSVALRTGTYLDAQLTRGADQARNGWGFDLRVTF
jgi:hypothetical protein